MGRHLLFVAVMTGPQMWIAKIIWMLTPTSRVGKMMVRWHGIHKIQPTLFQGDSHK